MTLGKTGRPWLAALALTAIMLSATLAVACGGDDDDDDGGTTPAAVATEPADEATAPAATATEPAATETEPAAEATEPATGNLTVQVAEDETLGEILTDSRGFTLYTFNNDTANSGESACLEGCASAWPPLTITGEGQYDAAVAANFGTITRPDGTTQVTYKGLPLYFFASDAVPGDTNGHQVGGVWFAATP